MTYEQVATHHASRRRCCSSSRMFAGVLVYAFWPGNKKRFEQAAQAAARERSRSRRERTD